MDKRGFTLIEIMVTLIIIGSILSMGIFTMYAYMPKQRLLDSVETMEQVLNRAQLEATARSTWSCVKYVPSTQYLMVYMDVNANHTAANGCGDTGDYLITKQQIRKGVGFASCTGGTDTSFDFTAKPIFFNTAGIPQYCDTTCSTKTFQIVLTNSDLKTGTKAREVEAITSGLIATVPRNEKGYLDTIFAKTATLTGTGACE